MGSAFITGSTTWYCPTGVTSVNVVAVGGGGGGKWYNSGGRGGGAGGYVTGSYTVTPGVGYTVTVGAGGVGGTSTITATAGGSSSFTGVITGSGGAPGGSGSGTGVAPPNIDGYSFGVGGNGGIYSSPNGQAGYQGAVYLTWTDPTYTYETITFNANGGSGTMNAQTGAIPFYLNTNLFTNAGYYFNGWNTSAGGGGTAYSDGALYTAAASVTLYAQWVAIPPPPPPPVGPTPYFGLLFFFDL